MASEEDFLRRLIPIMRTKIPTSHKTAEPWGTPGRGTQNFPQRGHGVLDAGAVTRGIAGCRRTEGSELTKRQVATQQREPRIGECFRKRAEERSLGVGSCAVSQNDAAAVGSFGSVQKSADRWVEGGVRKFADGGSGQENILNAEYVRLTAVVGIERGRVSGRRRVTTLCPFRLQSGITIPPRATLSEAPYHAGQPNFPGPVGSLGFSWVSLPLGNEGQARVRLRPDAPGLLTPSAIS